MKNIRYFFEGVLLFMLFGIFRILPARTASNIGGYLAKKIGPKMAVSRKPFRHLQMALPELTRKHEDILIGMWENLGRTFAEYAHLKKISQDHVTIHNVEIIQNALKDKKPVIFISGHLANWEVIAPALALQFKIPGLLVYRTPNNPYAAYLLDKARNVSDLMSFTTKSEKGVRDMVLQMRSRGIIGLLIDQKFNRGLEVPFFNHPAMTSSAFIELAQKYNASVIPINVERTEDINFSLTCYPALEIEDKPVEECLKETHILLENWIRQRPEQWLWLHKRWKED